MIRFRGKSHPYTPKPTVQSRQASIVEVFRLSAILKHYIDFS
jgi:hypothetical protein